MLTIAEVIEWLNELAPLSLSESWDNTGLLLGDRHRPAGRVMTCLTASANVVDEAIREGVDLVVAHHPLPFRPVKQITTDSKDGELLWKLASHSISLYAPHTAWDSAACGINQQLAELLDLTNIRPLLPASGPVSVLADSGTTACVGTGRVGQLVAPVSLDSLVKLLRERLSGCRMRGVRSTRAISSLGIACGSGASLLDAAISAGCDLFLTGEATYHACLEAEAAGIHLLMVGHFASERFAMQTLSKLLFERFPEMTTWAAICEFDPVSNF